MKYSLYGLTLDVPFSCPELLPSSGKVDVVVRWGRIDDRVIDWRGEGLCYKASPGKYLLNVKGVAVYFVHNGNEVVIERDPKADDDSIRLFLYNEVIGAMLLQRGSLPLKGCVVEHNGKGFGILGTTPSGKSMTAAGLAGKGFRIIADGLCCLTDVVSPVAQPGYPQLILWHGGLEILGKPYCRYKQVRKGMNRFYVPLEDAFRNEALSLERMYIITLHNKPGISVSTVSGAKKLFALLGNQYHPELTKPLGVMEKVNGIAASTAKGLEMRVIGFNDLLVPFGEYVGFLERELTQ